MTEFDKIKEDMEEWQNSFPSKKERRKSFGIFNRINPSSKILKR